MTLAKRATPFVLAESNGEWFNPLGEIGNPYRRARRWRGGKGSYRKGQFDSMRSLNVSLKNCYGIRELDHSFDTSKGSTHLVYAPNGAMKTSFAKVFRDLSEGRQPVDAVFPSRTSGCRVTDQDGKPLNAARVLVVGQYSDNYSSQKVGTLMADQALREEYQRLIGVIEEKTRAVLTSLERQSKVRGVGPKLTGVFGRTEAEIHTVLEDLHAQLGDKEARDFSDLAYGEVFNDKVEAFLAKASVRQHIAEYVQRYNQLLDDSMYFRRGGFNHTGATNVLKALTDNRFFAAQHTVTLTARDAVRTEVSSPKDLELAISSEKDRILQDQELAKRFEVIDKEISRNVELRRLRTLLEEDPTLVPELVDLIALERRVWLFYARNAREELHDLVKTLTVSKREIAEVVKKAKAQETEWRRVVEVFHSRFWVPFRLTVENQEEVILKDDAPSLVFHYDDGEERREIGDRELLNVLSTGESRALYLLNVIFEVTARQKDAEDTVLILDDIADSFDYRNKYAIVEYIKAIADSGQFLTIVLTHNFDFFRTVQSRLDIDREFNCLMTLKSDSAIQLVPAQYLDAFRYWRANVDRNRRIRMACIPMVRNLIEYSQGRQSDAYLVLTSVLHQKSDTTSITLDHLAETFSKVLNRDVPGGGEVVVDVILDEAAGCAVEDCSMSLENKVVLSMAIRLLAERAMLKRLGDSSVTEGIGANQTRQLFNLYKAGFPEDSATLKVFERVLLMTPESIHLNSFMYEPILDMADGELKSLFADLQGLG